jgi:sugar lactone lactonase YvrE
MKRLATIPVVLAISFTSSPQSFPAKNVNNDYVVTNLVGYDVFKDKIEEVLRDNSGLYWFQSITDLSSFDGINWRSYKIKTPDGRIVSTRFNDIEVTSDGTIWLATGSGIFVFDRASENFIPLKQKFPGDYEVPVSAACIYKGLDNIIFMSLVNDGFYFFDWQKKSLKHVSIDTISKSRIPSGYRFTITADRSGNFWGIIKVSGIIMWLPEK